MTAKNPTLDATHTPSTLMPISVDVDLVRFEKNLLQIGFFGANDARDKNRTSRRIEQVVFRNGQKMTVAAEFRGSELLGLPSTTDRDKFIALLKIISEERARSGSIKNPIRFSGYRLIQELGLSRNGEIYEEILRWGKRMTDTTITSEQVVYRAAKKVYSDEVLHVFRSFRRTGSSNLNGAERQEHYEVVLEDWLVENLNQRYVIPEDFNAYKQLTRPTAKGIFGNLHLWFHASQGRQVEKDYSELCNLLNVQVYPHLSKIKSTMGLALNELVKIRYVSKWDVQKMSSKEGYKIVLAPGDELLRLLDNTRPERRDSLFAKKACNEKPAPMLDGEQAEALDILKRHGVLAAKAEQLLQHCGAEMIIDTVDYLAAQFASGKRKTVDNPAGLIIHSLENALPIPRGFVNRRKRQEAEEASRQSEEKAAQRMRNENAYSVWLEEQKEKMVHDQFSPEQLEARLKEEVIRLSKTNELFRKVPVSARRDLAYSLLRREIQSHVALPSLDEWLSAHAQTKLFQPVNSL